MALTVHLIRHGHTAALGVCLAGRADGWPLTGEGTAACERLADGMIRVPLAAVISSPMLRTQQTAECIARRTGHSVRTDPGFDEIDFGEWTGRSFADLHGDPAWQAWNRHRAMAQIPGGETMLLAQARALASLGRVRLDWSNAEVAVVSHSDVIKAVLAALLGTSLDLMHRLLIDPASRSVVRLHAEGAEVVAMNLPPGC